MSITYKCLVSFLLSILLVIFVFFYSTQLSNFINPSEIGGLKLNEFGDFVGGILNPLLSFLTLIILLRTFSMQKTELDLQKEELKDTKELLRLQTETQVKQQFESMFFALLNVHNQVLQNLGREIVFDTLKKMAGKIKWEDDNNPKEEMNLKSANLFLKANNHLLEHYFQILYQLLKFIAIHSHDNQIGLDFDAEKIKNDAIGLNEKMYSNIVRSMLYEDLMRLLAINCYCENTQDNYHKYKLLVERYALFEHASFNPKYSIADIANSFSAIKEIRNFYDKKAFGL